MDIYFFFFLREAVLVCRLRSQPGVVCTDMPVRAKAELTFIWQVVSGHQGRSVPGAWWVITSLNLVLEECKIPAILFIRNATAALFSVAQSKQLWAAYPFDASLTSFSSDKSKKRQNMLKTQTSDFQPFCIVRYLNPNLTISVHTKIELLVLWSVAFVPQNKVTDLCSYTMTYTHLPLTSDSIRCWKHFSW